MLRWLAGRTTFTTRECFDAHRSRLPRATDLDAVLALLADHGYIRATPREAGPGRPSQRYDVHPAAPSVEAHDQGRARDHRPPTWTDVPVGNGLQVPTDGVSVVDDDEGGRPE